MSFRLVRYNETAISYLKTFFAPQVKQNSDFKFWYTSLGAAIYCFALVHFKMQGPVLYETIIKSRILFTN